VQGEETERIVELLDAVPAAEQDALLAALQASRPELVRRNLGQLPIESSLLRVPEAALAAAWAAVPIEDWVAYLRSAPEAIKLRTTAACPARIREGLIEELKLRVVADPGRAVEARRKIVRAAIGAGGFSGAAPGGNGARRPAEESKTAPLHDPARQGVKR
jgi:hypothetical protein